MNESFANFLNALGGLHDAEVVSLDWQVEARTFALTLDDLYANFRGLPEYPGEKTGSILLQGVSRIDLDIGAEEGLQVFDIGLSMNHLAEVVISFSPSGRVAIRFTGVKHPENELLPSPDDSQN